MFDKAAIIGIGLMGASLARAMRAEGVVRQITGSDPSGAARRTAVDLGIVDEAHENPAEAAAGAELIVVCSPLGTYAAVAEAIGPAVAAGAIVSDIGSVKSGVTETFAAHLPEGVHVVPGHPVAGSEKSGPEHGFAEMFASRWTILTPAVNVDPAAVAKLRAMWEAVGSSVDVMDPAHHDRVLAITSHLPHLIAYSIVATAGDLEDQLQQEARDSLEQVTTAEVVKYSAGGFRDFTRIAGSSPVMWRDIFLTNREAVLEMLGRFTEDLTALQRAIRWGKGDELHDIFSRTRELRLGIVEAGQAGTFSPVEPTTEDEATGDEAMGEGAMDDGAGATTAPRPPEAE